MVAVQRLFPSQPNFVYFTSISIEMSLHTAQQLSILDFGEVEDSWFEVFSL